MKYISATALLLAAGCSVTVNHSPTCDMTDTSHVCPERGHGPCPLCPSDKRGSGIYYQAFDEKWKHDPGVNPIFENKAEAEEYAKLNNMGNSHSYEVREVDYRYVVRVGFSDYTYANGSWNDILYTAGEFNDAYEYVVEYSSSHSDLIIYDLKTGKQFEETP